jgi:hypothetical protein
MAGMNSFRAANNGGGAALIALSVMLGWSATAPAAEPAGEPAVWTSKELHFVYQGFTAKYSCDGLRDKMRQVLLALGARDDLQVRSYGCSTSSGPDPFPGVRVQMNVLQPQAGAGGSAASGVVAAHWKPVTLSLDRDPLAAATDCELVEQVKRYVLPLFTTRNVQFRSACVPHQAAIGGTELRADVLVPDEERPTAAR